MKTQILYFFTFLILSFLLLPACRYNNIKVDKNVQDIIDKSGFKGSFMMMDNTHGEFTVSNVKMDTMRLHTDNSLAVLYALLALELGEVNNTSETSASFPVSIDSLLLYPSPANIKTVYQTFDSAKLKEMTEKLFYGNMNTSPESSMISIDEQLGLLKKMYFNQLSVSNRSMNAIKESMNKTTKSSSEKCNLTLIPRSFGEEQEHFWQMGWLDCEKELFFFVLYLDKNQNNNLNTKSGKAVLSEILNYLSIKGQQQQL